MALLLPSPEVSYLTVRRRSFEAPVKNITTAKLKCVQKILIFKSGNGNGRARVSCSSVKDLEEDRVVISRTSSSSSKQSEEEDEEEEKRNYYLNTGYAIRTLREEFPALFYEEPNFDIYREDIAFKDPLNTIVGIDNYKSIFWALRFHGRIFFRALWIDIVSVWQPAENVIMVRWTVHGIPRVPWESRGRFDGTSEYKLDKYGKIYQHRVHNIALNAPPKYRAITFQELIQVIGGSSTPKPTYFEIACSSIKDSPPTVDLTWVRHHLGSIVSCLQHLGVESSGRS